MKTIIDRLLIDIGLESVLSDLGPVYYFKDENVHSYWMVVESSDLSSLLEKQADYFVQAKEKVKNEWFEKNASLLILHKPISLDAVNKDQIIDIEENPYLFKKQVLLYTEEEKEKLIEAINISGLNIRDFIEKKILTEEVFEYHKTSINNNNFESLLYRIAHKIPFVMIKANQVDGLLDLTESNKAKIDDSIYKNLNDTLTLDLFERTKEELIEMPENEIYEQLIIVLNQNGN
ncbi:ABC-three component system middle component 1 [Flavobacterium sp. ACN6]|uniref:ABC-three component system middle component 1 n=1 Tax=Flavobacterium sp. ACN6 TaxID=1920426 RepID=UPI000BB3DA52|nr:ABC-three component system middle component 1 [Flavobacterium sp. ACN6]PBJ14365.1 hypothetical protein BSF42_07830 [Flavobacterium sp. ACN6]